MAHKSLTYEDKNIPAKTVQREANLSKGYIDCYCLTKGYVN